MLRAISWRTTLKNLPQWGQRFSPWTTRMICVTAYIGKSSGAPAMRTPLRAYWKAKTLSPRTSAIRRTCECPQTRSMTAYTLSSRQSVKIMLITTNTTPLLIPCQVGSSTRGFTRLTERKLRVMDSDRPLMRSLRIGLFLTTLCTCLKCMTSRATNRKELKGSNCCPWSRNPRNITP